MLISHCLGSRGSSGDKPEKTFMKHTLLTIPVEILEKIAHSAEKKVLLILGLTSTEVEKRTFNVFEARFLTNMVWDNYNTEAVGRVIAGLKAMPILAQRVKHLDFIFRDGRGNFINDSLDSFEADVRVLQNLSSLYFHGVHDQDWSYWGDRTLIYVPRLSQLTISACSNCYSFDWNGQFLEIHKATLTSVWCFDIAVEGPYQNHQPGWSRLLQAAKVLREAATVEISRPRVHVVSEKRRSKLFFVSLALFQKDTDAATDMAATPVSVLVGAKNGFNGIHYLTRAGELQIGLEHMMQNYAELHSAGDLAASGAVGYIVGLEGMDDREWREEAGLGDLDEYEDEDGDGEENGYDDYDDGWEHYARDFFSD